MDASLIASGSAANLDLNALNPALTENSAALATSDDGKILYGINVVSLLSRRFDANSSTTTTIPLLNPTDFRNPVAERGTSGSGDVAVGTNIGPSGVRAYRYVHGSGVTAIPLLPGGTDNSALAVSSDGDVVLVSGNSLEHPNSNGEAYLYDFSKPPAEAITRLGSPNAEMRAGFCANDNACGFALSGGMTDDGSVVVMQFYGAAGFHAYFRNEHGWFHIASALLANGVDIAASQWNPESLKVHGISSDGTLVFGSANRAGNLEGFVADFSNASIPLADYNPQPVAPASTSLVGVWTFCDLGEDPLCAGVSAPDHIVMFTADGVYFHIEGEPPDVVRGFERGLYAYDGNQLTITTLLDTNGAIGVSGGNGERFPVTVEGDILFCANPSPTDFCGGGADVVARRLATDVAGTIVGGWANGDPTQPDSSFLAIFLGSENGYRYFQATDNPEFGDDGSEIGTYTFNPVSRELNLYPTGGNPDEGNIATLAPDELQLHALDDDGHSEFHFVRVINPATPVITSALAAAATKDLPFAYQISATNSPSTFGAIGLPAGLTISAGGLIAGVPEVTGTFDVLIEASNTISTSTGRNHLSLVVLAPVLIGESSGPVTVTPMASEDPQQPPPLTLEFSNITSGGSITVVSIDPEADPTAPEPPSGFSLGDDPVYYEITPIDGLTFDGPVEVCFSYAGITFSGFPRLLHYDEALASWVDITTSVDDPPGTVCGLTSSFSPFVLVGTAVAAVGFHAPINPVAGAINTVRGGSTVALKFDVYSDPGVEITDPDDLGDVTFEATLVECVGGTAESWSDAATTGGTGLRYDTTAGQFIQNWKTPTTKGCYFVRLTGDGLLLSALFKVR